MFNQVVAGCNIQPQSREFHSCIITWDGVTQGEIWCKSVACYRSKLSLIGTAHNSFLFRFLLDYHCLAASPHSNWLRNSYFNLAVGLHDDICANLPHERYIKSSIFFLLLIQGYLMRSESGVIFLKNAQVGYLWKTWLFGDSEFQLNHSPMHLVCRGTSEMAGILTAIHCAALTVQMGSFAPPSFS
jgi:hypothetical protein